MPDQPTEDFEPEDGGSSVVPFPADRVRAGWLPNYAAAVVPPRRDETPAQELARILSDINRIRDPLELA